MMMVMMVMVYTRFWFFWLSKASDGAQTTSFHAFFYFQKCRWNPSKSKKFGKLWSFCRLFYHCWIWNIRQMRHTTMLHMTCLPIVKIGRYLLDMIRPSNNDTTRQHCIFIPLPHQTCKTNGAGNDISRKETNNCYCQEEWQVARGY